MTNTSDIIIKIQVNDGINNPSSAITTAFSLYIYSATLSVKDYTDNARITFTPGNMGNVNISSSSQNCGELASYTFSFIASQPVLKGGSIKISLPSFPVDYGIDSSQYLITPNTGISVINVNLIKSGY
jgi:hypothetical protein